MMAPPPRWLIRMANHTARNLRAADLLSPLGCHVYHNRARDQWEVTLFASRTETLGGKLDGQTTCSRFSLDLQSLLDLFEEVSGYHWQAQPLGPDDDLGPHVSLEGRYEGHSVWLRILAAPPAQFQVGRCLNVHDLRLEDLW